MADKPQFFSRDDVRVLQQMIAREKRQTVNVPSTQVSDRWDAGEDHQAPEVYVARPKKSSGIPGLTEGDSYSDYDYGAEYPDSLFGPEPTPGSAVCDIFKLVRGELVSVGREETVYNVGTADLAQSYFPIMRDKFGKWLAVSAGGNSGGSSDQIDFEVLAWIPDDALTTGCDAVYAVVTRVSCGSSVSVGDHITIYDPDLCWFNIPIDILVGLRGTAVWMESTFASAEYDTNWCRDAPLEGECLWVVKGICCREEVYASV